MSAQPARALMSIGEVLGLLRSDFPDVTISKIRFLESEGLIEPQRSSSGYRKFSYADVERLRAILVAQRDQYLPLRIIKERLDTLDSAQEPPGTKTPQPRLLVPAEEERESQSGVTSGQSLVSEMPELDGLGHDASHTSLTRGQLLDASGLDDERLRALEDYGLIQRSGRHYDTDALTVIKLVAELDQFGLQPRHLRVVKAAADREVSLVEGAVAPLARKREPDARERSGEWAREIAMLMLRLHAALLNAGVRHELEP